MSENKDLAYYMSLPYPIHIYPESDGTGYTAEIPDLPGCITCADTLPELWTMIEDAKNTWFEGSLEEGLPIPEPSTLPEEIGELPEPAYVIDAGGNKIAVQIDLNTWQTLKTRGQYHIRSAL